MSYSVIIPTYNSKNKVYAFSQSLFEALAKTPENVEFIFVDDGSTDNTWQLLKDIKFNHPESDILILRLQQNCGQLAATNCGISAAKYDLVVTIDDDGKYNANEVPRIIDFWRNNVYTLVFGAHVTEERMLHKSIFYFVTGNIIFPKFRNTSFSSFRAFSKSAVDSVLRKSAYGGNLHTLWLFKPEQIGNFMLTTQGIANSATRYNAFTLVMHQKYLLAYLLLILFSTLSFFSVVITGLYIWRHHAIKPAVYIMPVISVIFTILAYRLLKFWVGQSFKFAIREKG